MNNLINLYASNGNNVNKLIKWYNKTYDPNTDTIDDDSKKLMSETIYISNIDKINMTKLNGYNFEILYFTKDDTYINTTGWILNKNLIASRPKVFGTSNDDTVYRAIPSNASYLRLKVIKQSSSNDISISDISDLEIYLHTINNPINNPESVIISFAASYENSYFEECINNGGLYFKIPGSIYIRGERDITLNDSVYDKFNKVTSPNGISNCIYIPHNNILYYNISDSELYIDPIYTFDYRNENYIQFFVVAKDMSNDVSICDGIIGGRGKYFYDEWKNKYAISTFLDQKINNDYDNMNIIDNLKFYKKTASFINNKLSIYSNGSRLLSERINITRITTIDIAVPEGYKALFLACKDNDDFVLTTNWIDNASYIHIAVSGKYYKSAVGDKVYVTCPFQAKYGYILLAKNDDSTINLDEKSNYSISIVKNTNRIKTNSYIFVPSESNIKNIYFETTPNGVYFKLPGKLYLRGIHMDEVTNIMESLSDTYEYSTSPKGVDDCIYMPHNSILYYNLENSSIAIHNGSGDNINLFSYDYTNPSYVILFTIGKLFDHDDILNGELKYIYDEYKLYHNTYEKNKKLIPISTYNYEWEIGSLNMGIGSNKNGSTNRIRTKNYIRVGQGTRFSLQGNSDMYFLLYIYNFDKSYVKDLSYTHDTYAVENDCYVRILMKYSTEQVITNNDDIEDLVSNLYCSIIPAEDTNSNEITINNTSVIPTYYNTQLSDAKDSIIQNHFNTGSHGTNFIFMTDLHWQSNRKISPILVKDIIDNTPINKILIGGDLIGGSTNKTTEIKRMYDCISSYNKIADTYITYGNHDSNRIGTTEETDRFNKSQVYSLTQSFLQNNNVNYGYPLVYCDSSMGQCLYYYFDDIGTNTRFICLDSDQGSTMSTAQNTWLTSILNNAPDNYHFIIFAHILYDTSTSWHVGIEPSELRKSNFLISLESIVDTFNANNNTKKVEAIFGGHVHIDCDFKTPGGIPIIITDTDSSQTFMTYIDEDSGDAVKNYSAGTITECAFDAVNINYATKTIKCIRIGRGENRTISYDTTT